MASGDTLQVFYSCDMGSYVTPAYTARHFTVNDRPVANFFDGGSNGTFGNFTSVLTRNYGSSGITAYIYYATSGTTGDIDWGIAFERTGDGLQRVDIDDFATQKTSTGNTVPGTAYLADVVSIAFSNSEIDGLQAGELFRIQVERLATSTLTADAYLLAIELKET